MIHKKAKKRLLYPTRISETPRAVPVFRVLHWFLIKINISRIFFFDVNSPETVEDKK